MDDDDDGLAPPPRELAPLWEILDPPLVRGVMFIQIVYRLQLN